MSKKTNSINTRSTDGNNTNKIFAQSQKNQTEITKVIEESGYIKFFERAELFGRTLAKRIENYPNISEKLKHILHHDIGSIIRNGKDMQNIIKHCNNKQLEEIMENLKKRMMDAEKIVIEYSQLYDNHIPVLDTINLQTTLSNITEEIAENEQYKTYIQNTDIKFKIKANKNIQFCRGATYGIFHNLIKNAIKAVAEQQETIKKNKQTNEINISLENNKIIFHNSGYIPEHLQEDRNLFKFGTTTTGKGIGLYSADQRATKLGGSIDFTSSEQEGTTFTITLPEELIIKDYVT